MDHILSVDLGTTAIKVALLDTGCQVIAKSSQEYALLTPTTLAVELPVETYWQAFKRGVQEVLGKARVQPTSIRAFGISAQGETLILEDRDGEVLRDAIVWLDSRAQREAEILRKEFNQEIVYRTTGQVSIVPTWPVAKVLWVRENEPKIFQRVAKVLLIEDWFIHRLTGKYVAEGSLLCSTVYWDINRKTWWNEILDRVGLHECQLPEIFESGVPVGSILEAKAKELGLSPGTIVCTGTLDQAAGAIGVGNTRRGVFSENTGAALAICASMDRSFVDPKARIPCHYHGIPNRYMAHTFTTGGIVLKWFRDMSCLSEMEVGRLSGKDPYEILSTEAMEIAPGCDGLLMLPHLQGAMAPEANPKAKGVFYGITLRHSKGHFVRAILEGIAFIVRRNIEVVEELGIQVKEIRCTGGGSRSAVWNEIKAGITGKPVLVMANEEAACLGSAIVAGVGVGLFRGIEEACERFVQVKSRFEPDPKIVELYSREYEKYVRLYDSLVGMFAAEPSG